MKQYWNYILWKLSNEGDSILLGMWSLLGDVQYIDTSKYQVDVDALRLS